MQAMPLIPEQASELAWHVDALFWYITAVTTAGTVGVCLVLLYFIAAYRKGDTPRPTPRILGSHRLEILWTATPLVLFLTFFGWGVFVYDKALRTPPDAPEVYVVGKQWMWKIQHPNGVREINELHLPVNRPVKVTLTSEDVIHNFGIPAFRQKIDVIPGRYVTTWYQPTKVGRYHQFCDQYSRQGHAKMIGSIVVMEQAEYDEWLRGKAESSGKNSVDGSLAWEGRKLFLKLQCITCHSNNSQARAPVLEGLYGQRVPLKGGGHAVADEAYIRESIVKPKAKVVDGWEAIMPTYEKQVSEEDLIKVIAYIKSLRPGQTPVRTDEFPAPVGAPAELSPGETKQP